MNSSAVDPGRLLSELDDQWRLIGKSENGVLRACSMTLVVAAKLSRDPQGLGSTVSELMHVHPNRTILLRVAEGNARVQAHTSIQCWMPFGRRQQICCEQIEIDAATNSLKDVPPILFGLTVPDLPIAMWCPDLDLALRPELLPLLGLVEKAIVDTSCLAAAEAAWSAVQKLGAADCRVADLVWARVTRWRELLFQGLGRRDRRDAPVRARISWAGKPFPPAAMYLGAWLACSFGWQNEVKERIDLFCEDAAMPQPGTGRLRSLTIQGQSCSIRLYRPEGTGLSIQIEGVSAGAHFPILSDSELLREELAVSGRDRQFERALALCPAILEAAS